MRGVWRLGVVSALAVVAFAVALVNFRAVPARECLADAVADASYEVEFLTPISVGETTHSLRITRDGAPVTGAQVCLRADMGRGGMSGMGVSNVAHETGPGVYDVPLQFKMGGSWDATVLVTKGLRKPVKVPIPVEVR